MGGGSASEQVSRRVRDSLSARPPQSLWSYASRSRAAEEKAESSQRSQKGIVSHLCCSKSGRRRHRRPVCCHPPRTRARTRVHRSKRRRVGDHPQSSTSRKGCSSSGLAAGGASRARPRATRWTRPGSGRSWREGEAGWCARGRTRWVAGSTGSHESVLGDGGGFICHRCGRLYISRCGPT